MGGGSEQLGGGTCRVPSLMSLMAAAKAASISVPLEIGGVVVLRQALPLDQEQAWAAATQDAQAVRAGTHLLSRLGVLPVEPLSSPGVLQSIGLFQFLYLAQLMALCVEEAPAFENDQGRPLTGAEAFMSVLLVEPRLAETLRHWAWETRIKWTTEGNVSGPSFGTSGVAARNSQSSTPTSPTPQSDG